MQPRRPHLLMALAAAATLAAAQTRAADDALGLTSGYITAKTKNFDVQLARDAQLLTSLRPAGSQFDFLPADYVPRRARHGQHHWGDVTLRYREVNGSARGGWVDVSSAAARKPVAAVAGAGAGAGAGGGGSGVVVLAAAGLGPTLPAGLPLELRREWVDVEGDLGLRVTVLNRGAAGVEVGALGFPAEFNSIFSGRTAEQIQARCSLADPYVGMHGGYIRVAPVRGTGDALVVTPLGDTPLEAYRNLDERSYDDTAYASQTFEGLYEWQVLSKAWAEKEWKGVQPWNPPSSRILQPNESVTFGLRFSVAKAGVRGIEDAVQKTGTPVVVAIPGYILPRDLPGQLLVKPGNGTAIAAITVDPPAALQVTQQAAGLYQILPAADAWGRVRLTIRYSNNRVQTVHYYITKPAPSALADLGRFLTTQQWYTNTSDPFGRAPSVMTYDYEARAMVTQDPRVWIAGLSDEGGAGSFLAAAAKQAAQPAAAEVAKLEQFVQGVLWGTVQTSDFAVRKSVFFYEPKGPAAKGFVYEGPAARWGSWTSWNRTQAFGTDRAYDYVHVAAAYWALYRVGRAYPELLRAVPGRGWEWYLGQAHGTVMRCMATDVRPPMQHAGDGLMGETVFGELLADLKREGQGEKAKALEERMRGRARAWDRMAVPYGSEMAWDSTGQEGIYFWSKYFGYKATAEKTLNTVLGFVPTVPHWGWNGNARRYWDNIYGGKLKRYERQIHHYGSGLNALALLSAFRDSPTDTYLLRLGYAGMNGPLSNINQEGFASASFHSWPDTLKWDGYSGDYGPGFMGLVLGSATYLVDDAERGLVAYGGMLTMSGSSAVVQPRDAVRRKVFVGPLKLLLTIDAGIITEFSYNSRAKTVSLTLSQLEGAPKAAAAVLWLESDANHAQLTVTTPGLSQSRFGWKVPLDAASVVIAVGPGNGTDTVGAHELYSSNKRSQ